MSNFTDIGSGVTREQVFSAADALLKMIGAKPSRRAVRDHLGTGSMGTISKHMKAWEAQLPKLIPDAVPLAEGCISAIQDEIERRILASSESLTNDLKKLREDFEALEKENFQLTSVNSAILEEVERLKSELAMQAGKAEQVEVELDNARLEIQSIRSEAKIDKEKSDRTIEEQREGTRRILEEKRKTELELAALPELNKQAETVLRLIEALELSRQREEWFAERYEISQLRSDEKRSLVRQTMEPNS